MTNATAAWDNAAGFWQVTDEDGCVWEVVTTGDRSMLVQRQGGERYYGAVWCGHGGHGTIESHAADGDTQDGFDCNLTYTFSRTGGWASNEG